MKYNQKAIHDLLQLMTTTKHLASTGGFLSHNAYFVRGFMSQGIYYVTNRKNGHCEVPIRNIDSKIETR